MGCSYLEPFYQYHWCLPYPGHGKNGGEPILAGRWMGMMRWLPTKPFWMGACRLVDIWKDACCINACEACRSLMMVTSLIPSIQFRPGGALFYGRWLSTWSTESYGNHMDVYFRYNCICVSEGLVTNVTDGLYVYISVFFFVLCFGNSYSNLVLRHICRVLDP